MRAERRRKAVRDQEWCSCRRKVLFFTREKAIKAKRIGQAEYQCCFCGGWHLTHAENWCVIGRGFFETV